MLELCKYSIKGKPTAITVQYFRKEQEGLKTAKRKGRKFPANRAIPLTARREIDFPRCVSYIEVYRINRFQPGQPYYVVSYRLLRTSRVKASATTLNAGDLNLSMVFNHW